MENSGGSRKLEARKMEPRTSKAWKEMLLKVKLYSNGWMERRCFSNIINAIPADDLKSPGHQQVLHWLMMWSDVLFILTDRYLLLKLSQPSVAYYMHHEKPLSFPQWHIYASHISLLLLLPQGKIRKLVPGKDELSRVPSSYEWVGVQWTHNFQNKGSK